MIWTVEKLMESFPFASLKDWENIDADHIYRIIGDIDNRVMLQSVPIGYVELYTLDEISQKFMLHATLEQAKETVG